VLFRSVRQRTEILGTFAQSTKTKEDQEAETNGQKEKAKEEKTQATNSPGGPAKGLSGCPACSGSCQRVGCNYEAC